MSDHHLDENFSIGNRLAMVFHLLDMSREQRRALLAFLLPLELKDRETYEHSVRVAILGYSIGEFMRLDPKALFYAGLLHDIGKIQTDPKTLQKTEGWTPADTEEIKSHVIDGYKLLRGYFDFSAEVILHHHTFQRAPYPDVLPEPLHDYGRGTKAFISFYGRMLALADHFDALHRVNDRSGVKRALSGDEIAARMITENPDQASLVRILYSAKIFRKRESVKG
ncbi:MAG: metal dependent phosphohydrolase [Parcubacteria group bacterium]|nr:metal dependent phosphohydrolase [Parcubacteria group bacterium]